MLLMEYEKAKRLQAEDARHSFVLDQIQAVRHAKDQASRGSNAPDLSHMHRYELTAEQTSGEFVTVPSPVGVFNTTGLPFEGEATERDWPEDWVNGGKVIECWCFGCQRMFIGKEERTACRKCYNPDCDLDSTCQWHRPTEHDWPEDWPDDNGYYMCKCWVCRRGFFGHKRRHVCKKCAQVPERNRR